MNTKLLKRFRREAVRKVIVVRDIIHKNKFIIREDDINSWIAWDGDDWVYIMRRNRLPAEYDLGCVKDGYRKAINRYICRLASEERGRREYIETQKLNKRLKVDIEIF